MNEVRSCKEKMTMLKNFPFVGALIVIVMLVPAVMPATGQDATAPKRAADPSEPGHSYRLDFTISELEDGKKINTRQYSMSLNASDQNEIKIGTRVPVEVK